MVRNLREEIKRAAPRQSGRSPASTNPTFVGLDQDPNIFPMIAEAHQVADQFYEQYRILKAEMAILEAKNIELHRIIKGFMTPLKVIPPSPPKDQA